MTPNDNNQSNFSLNRNSNDNTQSNNDQQQAFVPFASFPANQPREYDMGIKQMVYDLVERKYCPIAYIARYQQLSAQEPSKYPVLDENTIAMLRAQGNDISPEARDFEVARVYNKLEIEIFEMSTSQLPQDKQDQLRVLTEQAQTSGGNQNELVQKIQEFMKVNVPNISLIVDQYMRGFMNQYLAGRY